MKGRRLALLMMVASLALTSACGGTTADVPIDLQGRWTTTDERYAAAWIQIGTERIDFGTVEGTVEGHFVTGYSTESSIDGEVHRIEYEGADGTSGRLDFFRVGDTIRLRRQGGLDWTRSSS